MASPRIVEMETPIRDSELAGLLPAELRPESWPNRILTGFGTALDSTVLRAMQLVVERALIPDSEDLEALRESAQAVLTPELQANPRRFFDFLDEPPHPLRMESRFRRRIEGGRVVAPPESTV